MKIFLLLFLLCSANAKAETGSIAWHAERTFIDAFDTTGLEILGVGAVATALATSQDQAMHDGWNNNQKLGGNVTGVGNFWGTGIPEIAIALGQIFLDQQNGIVDAEGLASSFIVTEALKYSVQRERPDSNNTTSFPSGHTQVSFASATNMQISYGYKVGVPFYAMGILTGLSRISTNDHWLSDVVAGATIGTIFGRAGFKHHVQISPMTINDGGQGSGVIVSWKI